MLFGIKSLIQSSRATENMVITDWVQPIIKSDNENSNFIVSCSRDKNLAWQVFDNNPSTSVGLDKSAGSFSNKSNWIQIKTTNGLNITKIDISNRVLENQPQTVTKGNVQVSSDGEAWLKVGEYTNNNTISGATWSVNLDYEGYYKYTRIYFTDGYSSNDYTWICVSAINITATELVG